MGECPLCGGRLSIEVHALDGAVDEVALGGVVGQLLDQRVGAVWVAVMGCHCTEVNRDERAGFVLDSLNFAVTTEQSSPSSVPAKPIENVAEALSASEPWQAVLCAGQQHHNTLDVT